MNKKIFFKLIILIALAGCNIKYIDAPVPDREDYWRKDGSSKKDIRATLIECGYSELNWTIARQREIDLCMLEKDFLFVDSPYGNVHARCKHKIYQDLPSCQSMRK